jgi:hypothetical protein
MASVEVDVGVNAVPEAYEKVTDVPVLVVSEPKQT